MRNVPSAAAAAVRKQEQEKGGGMEGRAKGTRKLSKDRGNERERENGEKLIKQQRRVCNFSYTHPTRPTFSYRE
jgi:hypothetical protein